MFKILFTEYVVDEDLPDILEPWKSEIQKAIKTKLTTRPEVYTRPLGRSLKGYRKLRVGGYRVVLTISNNVVTISAIRHRSDVYEKATKRFGING